jgi:hypothetical protein
LAIEGQQESTKNIVAAHAILMVIELEGSMRVCVRNQVDCIIPSERLPPRRQLHRTILLAVRA